MLPSSSCAVLSSAASNLPPIRPRYDGWSGETAAAKRRFRTPGCHALLQAVLEMAQARYLVITPSLCCCMRCSRWRRHAHSTLLSAVLAAHSTLLTAVLAGPAMLAAPAVLAMLTQRRSRRRRSKGPP